MTDSLAVSIEGVGFWRALDADSKPTGDLLGPRNRRRASQLGRALVDAAEDAMTEAEVDRSTVPTIVGSAVGEVSTMLGLLDQMFRSKEPMSPAAFTMSVHNAASGVLSIATGNRGLTTSIAADHDTPAAALTEGIGIVATEGVPVMITCGDEAVPRDLVPDEQCFGLMAAAVVLAPLSARRRGRPTISIPAIAGGTVTAQELELDFARNPQVGMYDLVLAVENQWTGRVALDRGVGRGFSVELAWPDGVEA